MNRRRLLIFGITGLLYAVLVFVTWVVGTHQAAEKTDAQLDYAILDFRGTVFGAIDAMLGNVAASVVRDLGSPKAISVEEARRFARYHDVDEVNVVDRTGRIIASSDESIVGCTMTDREKSREFLVLTNGTRKTFSQPFRNGAHNVNVRCKYLGCAFPDGNGFVQVGLSDTHLAKDMPSILGYIFDEWLLGKTGFFLCANATTDEMISNPVRHRDEAKTLSAAGFDAAAARPFEIVNDQDKGKTFVQRLYGEKCYCRSYLFAGHRFVPSLPEREYYDTRTAFVSVFGTLLLVVLAAFALFIDRMFTDSDRLRDYYLADEMHRAKEMTIAKTIQTSALPNRPIESPYFAVSAIMQAAKDVGGDFYDYFSLDKTHVAFLVADVAGKGVSGALYMMTSKTLIKDTLLFYRDPGAALTKVNEELCRNNPANMFLTAWVGVFDLENGVVTFANAGHNPPIRLSSGEPVFMREKSGPVLAFIGGIEYKSHKVALGVGDSLLLYTDGVTEALDTQDRLFGEPRLMDAVRSIDKPNPDQLCRVVRMVVAAFAEGAPQADDITILALKRTAAPRTYLRSFAPTQEGIALASEFLDSVLTCPPAVVSTAHVILDEICSNIVKHSGASGFELDIELLEDSGVKLTFIDDGKPYDPLTHSDPDTTLPAEDRPIGGLGILMVKKMADSVSYSRSHNRNYFTAVKH